MTSVNQLEVLLPWDCGFLPLQYRNGEVQEVAIMSAITDKSRMLGTPNMGDLIHAGLVVLICIMATVYASINHDKSDNIWIVYGSAIAFAAGRAGARAYVRHQDRD